MDPGQDYLRRHIIAISLLWSYAISLADVVEECEASKTTSEWRNTYPIFENVDGDQILHGRQFSRRLWRV